MDEATLDAALLVAASPILVADHYSGNWASAVTAAIAAVPNGGAVMFPRGVTITMSSSVALPSGVTLLIPTSCTIVKASGVNNQVFGLAAPTFPAYTSDVHIIGGTWRWDTSTQPSAHDERGFVMFKYGRGCTFRGGIVHGENASWPGWCASVATLSFCIDSGVRRMVASDVWKGVNILSDAVPDNVGRVSRGCSATDNEIVRSDVPSSYGSAGVRTQGSAAHPVESAVVSRNILTNASLNEFKDSVGCSFIENVVAGSMLGLSATGAPGSVVSRNRFTSTAGEHPCDLSVEVTGSPGSEVTDNDISHLSRKGVGIGVYAKTGLDSNGTSVSGNRIAGPVDGVQLIGGASRCRATGNDISECSIAVKVGPAGGASVATGDTPENVVSSNTISASSYGVFVKRSGSDVARDLVLEGNRFRDVDTPLLIEGDHPPGLNLRA